MLRFCTFTSPYTVNFKNVKPTFSSTSFDVVEQHSMSSNCYTFKAASSSLLIKNVHKHGIFFERRSHLLKRLFNINCQWGCWRQSSTFKAWEVKIKCHALLLWFLFFLFGCEDKAASVPLQSEIAALCLPSWPWRKGVSSIKKCWQYCAGNPTPDAHTCTTFTW